MMHLRKSVAIAITAISMGAMATATLAAPPKGEHKPTEEQLARMEKKHAEHLQALHDKLNITASQEIAWRTYLEKTEPKRGERPVPPEQEEKLTTPERLEKALQRHKDMQQHLEARLAATKALYAVLTPEQRTVFDTPPHRGERKPHGDKKPPVPVAP